MPAKSYTEIADELERRIGQGEWAPGDRLPTLQDLASEYGVGLRTIDSVVMVLKQRKIIQGRQGRGIFVVRRE